MGVEKEKALEIALSQIEKQFGKGAIMKLGDAGAKISVSVIPTGCIELDYALGVGGVPRGRIIEVFGPESSGKTTIALHIIAQSQKMGGTAAFIDAEHALDPVYAENLGVNVDELYVSQPDTGEQALEITEQLVRSGAIDVIVVDSVAALVPKAEIEGDMGDSHVGLQARLMSQARLIALSTMPIAPISQNSASKSSINSFLTLPRRVIRPTTKSRPLPMVAFGRGAKRRNLGSSTKSADFIRPFKVSKKWHT